MNSFLHVFIGKVLDGIYQFMSGKIVKEAMLQNQLGKYPEEHMGTCHPTSSVIPPNAAAASPFLPSTLRYPLSLLLSPQLSPINSASILSPLPIPPTFSYRDSGGN